jgi:hypothetical protein
MELTIPWPLRGPRRGDTRPAIDPFWGRAPVPVTKVGLALGVLQAPISQYGAAVLRHRSLNRATRVPAGEEHQCRDEEPA